MQGTTCLVTGATRGIGLEAAIQVSRLGAVVLVHGRDQASAERAAGLVRGRSGGRAEAVAGDLASLAQVEAMAADLLSRHPVIDVLVNNAGAYMARREVTVDGHEATLAINHLAHFSLTNRLLPALRRAPAGRVVTVASVVANRGRLDLADLEMERSYTASAAYCRSKLANILFSLELADRLVGSTVTSNCLHPGAVPGTGLARQSRLWTILELLGRPFLPSPAQGASTTVYLASASRLAGVSGLYYAGTKAVRPPRAALDATLQHDLWELSSQITGTG